MCHDTPGAAVKHRLPASAGTSRRCAKAGAQKFSAAEKIMNLCWNNWFREEPHPMSPRALHWFGFGGTSVFVVICSFHHSKPENLQIYSSYAFLTSQCCNTNVILEDEKDWFKKFWIPCSSCSSPLPENSASLARIARQLLGILHVPATIFVLPVGQHSVFKYCNIYYLPLLLRMFATRGTDKEHYLIIATFIVRTRTVFLSQMKSQ